MYPETALLHATGVASTQYSLGGGAIGERLGVGFGVAGLGLRLALTGLRLRLALRGLRLGRGLVFCVHCVFIRNVPNSSLYPLTIM